MSAANSSWFDRAKTDLVYGADGSVAAVRLAALACSIALVLAYVRILREITRAVGGTETLTLLVVASLVLGTVAALTVGERTAITVSVLAGVGAFAYYFSAAGIDLATALTALDQVLSDAYTLTTGVELIRVHEARTWALAYVPVPTFLTWYLALRRRYALATIPGGLALGFLVLTGDAGLSLTLGGTIAGVAMVAFGELDRHGGGLGQADLLVVLIAAMIFLSLFVPLVPGGTSEGQSLVPGAGSGTLEGSVAADADRSTITGSVDLSPEVRFTIESDEPAYWRSGVYDRFTGDEWVTTGEAEQFDGSVSAPPGRHESMVQTVQIETQVRATPAAAKAIRFSGTVEDYLEVTEHEQVRPSATLFEGDEYTVESAVIDPSPEELRAAGTNYADDIESRYLQEPDDRTDEFAEYTSDVVGDADTPYDAAVAIEEYLRNTKEYSLDVDRPSGDVAEAYLFEMDEGYCVYAATTMVQMLRSEGIPARYATGYTEGQQVDEDTWVVRGLDAHAWPEVYFPGHGWVEFEPTPMSDRDDDHAERLEEAREDDESNIDTDESEGIDIDRDNESTRDDNRTNGDDDRADDGDDSDGGLSIPQPSREQLAFTGLALLGLVAGAHRFGAPSRLARLGRLYWQRPTGSPNADAERAYRRLEDYLGARYRPRSPTESPRAYLEALSASADLDERVHAVAAAREQATFGPGVDRVTADEAIAAVDELVYATRPIRGVGAAPA